MINVSNVKQNIVYKNVGFLICDRKAEVGFKTWTTQVAKE
jgi:hypothetical protein